MAAHWSCSPGPRTVLLGATAGDLANHGGGSQRQPLEWARPDGGASHRGGASCKEERGLYFDPASCTNEAVRGFRVTLALLEATASPDDALMTLTAPKLPGKTPLTEPIYGTKHGTLDVSAQAALALPAHEP